MKISASDAKNKFGGLLENVAVHGRVEIVRHGRRVAVVLSPREFRDLLDAAGGAAVPVAANQHMIPAHLARRARIVSSPVDFDED